MIELHALPRVILPLTPNVSYFWSAAGIGMSFARQLGRCQNSFNSDVKNSNEHLRMSRLIQRLLSRI
jgi:hypothetical protein